MNTHLKVLIINASETYGGVSAVLYNYYHYMDKSNLSFDFLSPKVNSFLIKKEEIEKNNDKLYALNIKKDGYKFYIEAYHKLKDFFSEHKYDIIHINSGLVFYNALVAYTARKYSKARIIVHSHSAYEKQGIKKILSIIAKKIIEIEADYYLACSIEAANTMFSKKNNEKQRIYDN